MCRSSCLIHRYATPPNPEESFLFRPEGGVENGEQRYVVEVPIEQAGKLEYRVRAYPRHAALSHRFEMGLMRWI